MPHNRPARMTRFGAVRAWRRPCAALALLGACALASGADTLTPDERLAAIRKGLVQAALEGPTQVSATQWIDGNGALQESSSFRAGMQVRGVRVLGYEADAQGDPLARLQWLNADGGASRPVTGGKTGCSSPRNWGLQHVLAWNWNWNRDRQANADHAPVLEAVQNQVLAQLQQNGGSGAQWRLVERPRQDARSSYQQALLGSSLDTMPWHLQVQASMVAPLPVAQTVMPNANKSRSGSEPETMPLPAVRGLAVQIRMTLDRRNQAKPALQASAELTLQVSDDNWGSPTLSPSTAEQLAAQVQIWKQDLQRQLACLPVVGDVVQAGGAQVRINVGSAAGVRVGDEWVLAHDQQVVQRALEPGVVNQTVLAVVQSVGPYYAELRPVAGNQKNVQTSWTAWSADALR